MKPIRSWRDKEVDIFFELAEALHESLDINRTLRAAYPLLCKLVPADHGAMCISRTEDCTQYDWTVAEIPEKFFRAYPEIAPYDFVRIAVAQKPNIVLCDADMLHPEERARIDRHPLVQYSRSNDMRVEQIMAVKFETEPTWNGGLTLYRDRPRAFSDRERSILQRLLPIFSRAMANCKRYGDHLQWSSFMDTSLTLHRTGFLVFSKALKLVRESNGIDQVLDRCFGKRKRGQDRLPFWLRQQIEALPRDPLDLGARPSIIPPMSGAGVVVTFVPEIKAFGMYWMVLLDEVPEEWREKLTKTEIDVAVRAAQGLDNDFIAKELNGISPATVRTHLYNIFNKLGIDNRTMLAARFRAPK